MIKNIISITLVLVTLLITFNQMGLEAKHRTRTQIGFSFNSGYRTTQPVYVVPRVQPVYPRVQPVYVVPSNPACHQVVYEVPAYAPVYVYPQEQRSSWFSINLGSFWR